MRKAGSTSVESSPSAGPDALIALVRLLARQAAREFAAEGPARSDKQPQPRGDR
jgi:hypothetical protein